MSDVFISYAREDTEVAQKVGAAIQGLGWSVWIDKRLKVGKSFSNQIALALESASSVVVLWSQYSVASEWVLKEAAIGKHRDVLVPVVLDRVELPKDFAELQTTQLRHWDGGSHHIAFGRLCLALAERLGTRNEDSQRIVQRARRELEDLRQGASRWADLAAPARAREDVSWPYWMVRYIVADTPEALDDLMWSVGGSPPYGGVAFDEAKAVYLLVEQFTGPGRASEAAYAAVERFLTERAEASRALEAFRIFDRVASNSETYTDQDLRIGGVNAVDVVDEPLSSYFDFLAAQLRYRERDVEKAYQLSQRAIDSLKRHFDADPAYRLRLVNTLTNTCSFAVMNGDFLEARRHAAVLEALGEGKMLQGLRDLLRARPIFPQEYAKLTQVAGDQLEAGRPHCALEWFLEAERVAVAENRDRELPGLLGDIAVAYRRIGNEKLAISTNRRAIEASQRAGDMLNLTRWCQNLAGLLFQTGDVDAAVPYARTAIYAAARLRSAQQLALATRLLLSLLGGNSTAQKTTTEILVAARRLIDNPDRGNDSTEVLSVISGWLDQLSEPPPFNIQ